MDQQSTVTQNEIIHCDPSGVMEKEYKQKKTTYLQDKNNLAYNGFKI